MWVNPRCTASSRAPGVRGMPKPRRGHVDDAGIALPCFLMPVSLLCHSRGSGEGGAGGRDGGAGGAGGGRGGGEGGAGDGGRGGPTAG